MGKVVKLSLAEVKALLPPMPVLANESQDQFERFFDQVMIAVDVQDPVELILIRDFVWPSWEIARYSRHRVVAFDRKFKDLLESQVEHLQSKAARREALAQQLAEYLAQRPGEASHLVALEDKVVKAHDEVSEILKTTPSELAYNRALERNINFHKDLEFLITSATKRRDRALEMLDRYRNGLGRRVKRTMDDILEAEFGFVNGRMAEALMQRSAPQLAPPPELDANAEADIAEDQGDGRDA
jgi:hypothetical protein